MANTPKIVSVDEARRWYEEGHTYAEMARMHFEKYGVRVTPSAYSSLRRRYGWEPRLASENPLIPWKVKDEHHSAYSATMLRRENRRRQGMPWMSRDPEEDLDRWIENLKAAGAVVDYRPDTREGFFLTYARPGIDNDLIRVPDEG